MGMKKIYGFMMALMLLAMVGCSNDDVDVKTDLTGEWELQLYDKGWLQTTEFMSHEVLCLIYEGGIIEMKNNSDINLSPLVNKGKYAYQINANHTVTINGTTFDYSIEDNTLRLSHNRASDGPMYVFNKIR